MILKAVFVLCVLYLINFVRSEVKKHVGSACVDQDNVTGVCLDLYKCPSAVAIYLYFNNGYDVPTLPEVCLNHPREPVVCCTDCFVDEEKKSKGYDLNRFGVLVDEKAGRPSESICKQIFNDRPYQCLGKDTVDVNKYLANNKTCHLWHAKSSLDAQTVSDDDPKENIFSHLVLLGYGEEQETAHWMCEASLLTREFFLTAAHCALNPTYGSISYAATGMVKPTNPKDNWHISTIIRTFIHPEYNPSSRYHDIAIAEADYTVEYNKNKLPACVYSTNIIDYNVQRVGWGRFGNWSIRAVQPQVVDPVKFDDAKCKELFPPDDKLDHGYDPVTQICYGNPNQTIDSCEADGGAPIQTNYRSCQYTVVGVKSYSKDCSAAGGATLYTRVNHYVDWIESIVWKFYKNPYESDYMY